MSGESCVVNPGSAATTRDWPNSAQLGLHPCTSHAEALNRDGIVRRGGQIEAQALLCLDGEQTKTIAEVKGQFSFENQGEIKQS